MEEKLLSLGKFSAVATGVLLSYFGLLKLLFLKRHVTRKLTMIQKGIITINPNNLTKVMYINSVLKFLNNESLMDQVSNTTINIQSLHLWSFWT